MSWGGNHGRGHYRPHNPRQVNNWTTGHGQWNDQFRSSSSRNERYGNYDRRNDQNYDSRMSQPGTYDSSQRGQRLNYSPGGYNHYGDLRQQNADSSYKRGRFNQSETTNPRYTRTDDICNSREHRTSPGNRTDRSRSRSTERSIPRSAENSRPQMGSESCRNDESRNSKEHMQPRQTETNAVSSPSRTPQDGSSTRPSNTVWDAFLRQKTQKDAKKSQKSQRTKDYVNDRNKAIKESNKPTDSSKGRATQTSGSAIAAALDNELTLDDLIGGGNYGANDDEADNRSEISTISGINNPRGVQFSVTLTYENDKFFCGECTFEDKELSVAETHAKARHVKKANVIRYKCKLCKFATVRLQTWKQHVNMSIHQLHVKKQRSQQTDDRPERHNEVDQAGFAVPQPRLNKPGAKNTPNSIRQSGHRDPWSRPNAASVGSVWDRRSTDRSGEKKVPWNRTPGDSSRSTTDTSFSKQQGQSTSSESGTVLFKSNSTEKVKSPPWSKRPLLGLDSVKAVKITKAVSASNTGKPAGPSTYITNVTQASPPPTTTSNSTESGKTRQSSSPQIAQTTASLNVHKHPSGSRSLPPASHGQNRNSSRNPQLSIPATKSTSNTTASVTSMHVLKSNVTLTTSNSLPVCTSSGTTSSTVSTVRHSSSVQRKSGPRGSDVSVTSKTAPTANVSYNALQKSASAPGPLAKITQVRSEGGRGSPQQGSNTSPDIRSPRSTGLSPSHSAGNRPASNIHGSASDKELDKAGHSSKEQRSSVDLGKHYTIPKVNEGPRSAAPSTVTSGTNTSSQGKSNAIINKPVSTKSTSSIPSLLDGDLLSSIAPDLPYNISTQKNRHPVTTQPQKTMSETSGLSNKGQSTTSVKTRSNVSQVQRSGASPEYRSRHNSGQRSRHSSGQGSAGSASPFDTQSSPSDKETQKKSSVVKTTLGIREKNASYDPRDNCVSLSGAGKPVKPSARPHGTLVPKPNQSAIINYATASKPTETSTSGHTAISSNAQNNSPEKRTLSNVQKVQEQTVRKPAVVQDPRKVTHSSKLNKGAIIAKSLGGFKIPKQRSQDISDELNTEHADESNQNMSVTKRSPERKKHKSGKIVRRNSKEETNRDTKEKSGRDKEVNNSARAVNGGGMLGQKSNKRMTPAQLTSPENRSHHISGQGSIQPTKSASNIPSLRGGDLLSSIAPDLPYNSSKQKQSQSDKTKEKSLDSIREARPQTDTTRDSAHRADGVKVSSTSSLTSQTALPRSDADGREKINDGANTSEKRASENHVTSDTTHNSDRQKPDQNQPDQRDFTLHSKSEMVALIENEEEIPAESLTDQTTDDTEGAEGDVSKQDAEKPNKETEPGTRDPNSVVIGNEDNSCDNSWPIELKSPPWSKQPLLSSDFIKAAAIKISIETASSTMHQSAGSSASISSVTGTSRRLSVDEKAQETATGEKTTEKRNDEKSADTMDGQEDRTTDTTNESAVGETSTFGSIRTATELSNEPSEKTTPEGFTENSGTQRERPKNSFIQIDAMGRMLCWKCGGKMFPKCASAVISSHLQKEHMDLTMALYECIPCDFRSEKCREFKSHMLTQAHGKNHKAALSRRPSEDQHEMIVLEDTPRSNSTVTVKVEEEAAHVTKLTGTADADVEQDKNPTEASEQSGATKDTVQVYMKDNASGDQLASDAKFSYLSDLEPISPPDVQIYHKVKVENDSSDDDNERKEKEPAKDVVQQSAASTTKRKRQQKCECTAETYPHIHCPECGLTGKTPSAIENHRFRGHGIMPEEHELYRCPLENCSGVYLYPSGLKQHIVTHMKREKTAETIVMLHQRLNEIEARMRPRKEKVKNVPLSSKKRRLVKIPKARRQKSVVKGEGKLQVWYRYRKRKLLTDVGLTSSGRYAVRMHDERLLCKYRYVVNNQEMYKCKKCDKIRRTTHAFKYHMLAAHGVEVGHRPEHKAKLNVGNSQKQEKCKSPESEEKGIILDFLKVYNKEDRYECDKCYYSTKLRNQRDFREHMYKDHNVFTPKLRHYVCSDCSPVFRTIKQNKMEAHLVSKNHVKFEKAKSGSTSTDPMDEDMDDASTGSRGRQKRTELMRIIRQYQHDSVYACPQCGKTIEIVDSFVNHMFCEHNVKLCTKDCTYYECVDCVPAFRTSLKARFAKHEQSARHKQVMELTQGGKKRSNSQDTDDEPVRKKSKLNHAKNHTVSLLDTETFVCDLCKSNFASINDVGNHLDSSHTLQIESFQYNCQFCKSVEQSLIDFREHMKSEDHELEVALARSRAEYVASKGTAADSVHNQNERSSDVDSEKEGLKIIFKVTDKGLTCESCSVTTSVFDEFTSHIKRRHQKSVDLAFSCEVCNFENSSEKEAMIHVTSVDHNRKMTDAFEECTRIVTNLTYRITSRDKILCMICKRKIFKIVRLSTHAEEKHQLAAANIRVLCRVCNEILLPDNVDEHRKLNKHRQQINTDVTSSDTDSCPPPKRQRLEGMDMSSSFEESNANPRTTVVPGPSGTKSSAKAVESTSQSNVHQAGAEVEPPIEPSDQDVEADSPEEDVVPGPEFAPPQERPQYRNGQPPAQQGNAANQAPAPVPVPPPPPPVHQPYQPITLADFTTEELYNELCTRDGFVTCGCGFAYFNDRVAVHLHKSCHAVNDWHKCRICYKTFDSTYSFTAHLFHPKGTDSPGTS